MATLTLSPTQTALVLIDLERGIVGRELAPHTGMQVVQNASLLAAGFRRAHAVVVYVRVDLGAVLRLPADSPVVAADAPPPPASASELLPEAGFQPGDLLISKRQWGAFYGTDLDQQLRRRRITTIVLGGIATNYGVESTARAAAERGYEQVFVEDAMTSASAEAHAFPLKFVFPRIGRVRTTADVLAAFR